MSFKSLLEPIIESGIKNTNYFEGRLLSGKDLTEQEAANRRHRQQLGLTMGHGVVNGLNVSVESNGAEGSDPVVRVEKGMAITLEGDVVELPLNYIDLKLSRSFEGLDASLTGFKSCSPLPSEKLVPSGAGLYILVMSPANAYEEYAPKSGLQKKGIAHNCGRAYLVEGVKFRLVKFDPTLMPNISEATRSQLSDELLSTTNPVTLSDIENLSLMRNLVAHVCFGTDGVMESATDPTFLNNPKTAVGLDALVGLDEGFDSCDTPLAMIYWNLEGIAFVDNWAVKRKASQRDIVAYSIPSFTRHSYSRSDESRLQFQDHIKFLQDEIADLSEFNVIDYFRYLPPVGYIPVDIVNTGSGFTEKEFFDDLSIRKSVFIEASGLVPVTQVAMTYWPIDLESEEFMWLYRTRENAQQADNLSISVQEYIVFASGHSPYAGNARFNLSKWDYSNYGLI